MQRTAHVHYIHRYFFKGEKMDNLDEKHLNMLRNHLSVYEVDSIQCQLMFEKQTIVLDVRKERIVYQTIFFYFELSIDSFLVLQQ